ncbi:MAG: hypothetical protein ACTSRG_19865 [Candidatus Helarchaeota archaeon]
MIVKTLNSDVEFLKKFENIFSAEKSADFLFKNESAIFILVHFIKAKNWPVRKKQLDNEPTIKIPLLWAYFYASDNQTVKMVYDIHPMKCFPTYYNQKNPNAITSLMPTVKTKFGILGGCLRTNVTISGTIYNIPDKTPEYCSIFGLPDDCFDPSFEKRMKEFLSKTKMRNIWCFEKTGYIEEKISSDLKIQFMKGEFLPSRYFLYCDTSSNFLRGILKARDLSALNAKVWYNSGKEFIEDMNINYQGNGYHFEEQALFHIEKRLKHEFLREIILLMNQDSFSLFKSTGPQELDKGRQTEVQQTIKNLITSIESESNSYLNNLVNRIIKSKSIKQEFFKKSRFLVMDVEFLHIKYPKKQKSKRFFNFPILFTNLIWQGSRKGMNSDIKMFNLPCHSCKVRCELFKKRFFDFNCLAYGYEFVDNQISLLEKYLMKYENFKIFTYGKSDAFEIEHALNFFSDSYESKMFERRNRKRTRRIVDLTMDLAIRGKKLRDVENEILKKWLEGWNRIQEHVDVNKRLMKPYGAEEWVRNYRAAIETSIWDSISTFLLLVYKSFTTSTQKIFLKKT